MPAPNRIDVQGLDKELVGQVAADIRKLRKPEGRGGGRGGGTAARPVEFEEVK